MNHPVADQEQPRPHSRICCGDTTAVAVVGLAVLGLCQGLFGYYEDEGFNLLKARLVVHGHSLYDEIYSDQAPLFTWVLALLMWLGADDRALRLVPVGCGLATLLATHRLGTLYAGRWAGGLSAAVLLCWAPFLKFATTIVISTPALALGCWSVVWSLKSAGARPRRSLVISGILLGTAAAVKLATLYFLPVIIAAILLSRPNPAPSGRLKMLGLVLSTTLIPLALVAAVVPLHDMIPQVLRPHTTGLEGFAPQSAQTRRTMLLAPGSPALYACAVAAIGVQIASRGAREAAILIVWLAVATAWMLFHSPLWSHHLPDFLVPLTITAAVGAVRIAQIVRLAPSPRARFGQVVISALMLYGAGAHVYNYAYWKNWYDNTSEASLRAVAALIAEMSAPTDWVLVDRPILAYWANRRTPPWLALILRKRIFSGDLTDQQLVDGLQKYRPTLVVLCDSRLDRFTDFQRELRRQYARVRVVQLRRQYSARDGMCLVWRGTAGRAG